MIREKMQNIQMKRVVILSIPYLIIFYLADKCFWLYRHCIGDSMIEKIGVMLMNFQLAFTNWLPSFHMQDLLGGLVTALIFRLILYYKAKNAKKFRHGEEYGSARWGIFARHHVVDTAVIVVLCVTVPDAQIRDRKSTRLNSSHVSESRMPSSA